MIRTVRAWTARAGEARATALIDHSQMTYGYVAVEVEHNGKTVWGFGYTGAGRYSHASVINERFVPRLTGASPEDYMTDGGLDPVACERIYLKNERVSGFGEQACAAGGLSIALWDAAAKLADRPLAVFLSAYYGLGEPAPFIPVYIGGGYYTDDPNGLTDELKRYRDLGLDTVKLKTGKDLALDLKRLDQAASLFDPDRIAVDASMALDAAACADYARAYAERPLMWFEDPVRPFDFEGLKRFKQAYGKTMATGEGLLHADEIRCLLLYGGLDPATDWLLPDPAHCFGAHHFKTIVELCESFGFARSRITPHGGHLFSLHLCHALHLGMAEVYPFTHQPIGGFGVDFIDGGRIAMPEEPGCGFERKPALMDAFRAGLPA